jgi:glycerol-3-phosphate dehydrogenase
MSEEAADLAAPALKHIHVTANRPLNGNSVESIQALLDHAPGMAERAGLETSEVILLIRQYGVLTPAVIECTPDAQMAGLSRLNAARLIFAVRHEMAQKPDDFLTISTGLAYENQAAVLSIDAWKLASQV